MLALFRLLVCPGIDDHSAPAHTSDDKKITNTSRHNRGNKLTESASAFRYIPNVISVARIVATPILVYLALSNREDPFKWLFLAALLSDIADGLIARIFSFTSKLGSRLDTLADTLLWIAAVVGIWQFHPELVSGYWLVVVLVLGLWALEHIVALLRYGRLTSFHTYATRAGAYALGIFIMSLFLWGLHPWLLYLAASLSILGNIEELIIIVLLPIWTSDVRGLYWVLRKHRLDTA
jgi:phosphatidylglycerophosphate synthase